MQKSNGLYLVIGVLVAVIAIGGYYFYQESQKTGIDVEIGDQGISVETK
jgi:predicted negative regulator of RcsB-dependent stress response